MDIIQLINQDNQELKMRAELFSAGKSASDDLTEIRQWCWDVISSEEAKVKVLYRQLLEDKSVAKGLHDRIEMIQEQSRELQAAVGELLAIDPIDRKWDEWWRSTMNLMNSKIQTEASLLNEITPYFSELDLGKMVTGFERARESNAEIGEFQYKNAPFKTTPRPHERP